VRLCAFGLHRKMDAWHTDVHDENMPTAFEVFV
jgi:hypothetical protein